MFGTEWRVIRWLVTSLAFAGIGLAFLTIGGGLETPPVGSSLIIGIVCLIIGMYLHDFTIRIAQANQENAQARRDEEAWGIKSTRPPAKARLFPFIKEKDEPAEPWFD